VQWLPVDIVLGISVELSPVENDPPPQLVLVCEQDFEMKRLLIEYFAL